MSDRYLFALVFSGLVLSPVVIAGVLMLLDGDEVAGNE